MWLGGCGLLVHVPLQMQDLRTEMVRQYSQSDLFPCLHTYDEALIHGEGWRLDNAARVSSVVQASPGPRVLESEAFHAADSTPFLLTPCGDKYVPCMHHDSAHLIPPDSSHSPPTQSTKLHLPIPPKGQESAISINCHTGPLVVTNT